MFETNMKGRSNTKIFYFFNFFLIFFLKVLPIQGLR